MLRLRTILLITIPALLLFCLPDTALAWGPATHLEIGHTIISNLLSGGTVIGGTLGALISRYPQDFLYGNISADIVVGKNMVEELKHCHNWKFGFALRKEADTDSQRAFALGYLCHLGADTIAHNHFIPEMMIRSFSTRTLRHIYWEMRFDALADAHIWKLPNTITRKIQIENDRLLDTMIEQSPLPFKTNKRIFSSMLNLQRVAQWRKMISALSVRSKWKLEKEFRDEYFSAALEAATEILVKGQKAKCARKDPTGKHALNTALFLRKKLKKAKLAGSDWESAMANALSLVQV
jgi:hypothetical protein